MRYWQENGEVKGIAIRGLQVGKSDWLQWPELAALEDLLLIDTRGVRHIKLPPTVKRLDLSDSSDIEQLAFSAEKRKLPLTDLYAQRSGLVHLNFPNCPHLKVLHLRSLAGLERVVFTEAPIGLGVLELEDCPKLKQLPVNAILQENLFYLDARKTQPENCPASFVNEKLSEEYLPRIRNYFQQLEDQCADSNTYVKLLINGNGHVGKTTLWSALKNLSNNICEYGEGELKTTHGIRIEELTVEGVDFWGWDFGGQEIYHGTHQLFFADGAVNVLVLDYESEQKAEKGEEVSLRAADQTLTTYNHPLMYFFERQRKATREGRYFVVQTKCDKEIESVV
ncbi:MAG: ADP-ribosylation factor-like protein, partial [Bacteroidota bacterium]